jgi:hypothetical protein
VIQENSRRATQAALSCPIAALFALAAPGEGSRVLIPGRDGILHPGDDLLGCLGMLAGKGSFDDDPLERFSEPKLLHLL